MTPDAHSKSKARDAALAARRAMTTNERIAASARICERIVRSHQFRACKNLGAYLPMRDEVDPTRIIERAWRAQKRVFVPVTDSHGTMNFCEIEPDSVVTRNRYGLWEPLSGLIIDSRDLDCVITPLVAFDNNNRRIGMGGGYYDRCFHFLKNRRKWLKPKLIGVAFACQESDAIKHDSWDVPLYSIVTENS
ncbi:MAG: 5-formyltetrahydrofolate cyclo-ligase [Gammaproteobacteria bacterium]